MPLLCKKVIYSCFISIDREFLKPCLEFSVHYNHFVINFPCALSLKYALFFVFLYIFCLAVVELQKREPNLENKVATYLISTHFQLLLLGFPSGCPFNFFPTACAALLSLNEWHYGGGVKREVVSVGSLRLKCF